MKRTMAQIANLERQLAAAEAGEQLAADDLMRVEEQLSDALAAKEKAEEEANYWHATARGWGYYIPSTGGYQCRCCFQWAHSCHKIKHADDCPLWGTDAGRHRHVTGDKT